MAEVCSLRFICPTKRHLICLQCSSSVMFRNLRWGLFGWPIFTLWQPRLSYRMIKGNKWGLPDPISPCFFRRVVLSFSFKFMPHEPKLLAFVLTLLTYLKFSVIDILLWYQRNTMLYQALVFYVANYVTWTQVLSYEYASVSNLSNFHVQGCQNSMSKCG